MKVHGWLYWGVRGQHESDTSKDMTLTSRKHKGEVQRRVHYPMKLQPFRIDTEGGEVVELHVATKYQHGVEATGFWGTEAEKLRQFHVEVRYIIERNGCKAVQHLILDGQCLEVWERSGRESMGRPVRFVVDTQKLERCLRLQEADDAGVQRDISEFEFGEKERRALKEMNVR